MMGGSGVFQCRGHETFEEGVRFGRAGLELGVVLDADVEVVLRHFDGLDDEVVGGAAGQDEAGVGEHIFIKYL